MKVKMNAIGGARSLNNSAVIIKYVVVSAVFSPGVTRISEMVDAKPVVDPSSTLTVRHRLPEALGHYSLKHRIDLIPRVVIIYEIGMNYAGDVLLSSSKID